MIPEKKVSTTPLDIDLPDEKEKIVSTKNPGIKYKKENKNDLFLL